VWNGINRRKNKKIEEYDGERRSKIRVNFNGGPEMYMLDMAIRVLFLPDFNVWQIHKMDYPSWKQLRFEVVGQGNGQIAFDVAILYIKFLKYGLSEEEHIRLIHLGYDTNEDEKNSADL